MKITILPFSVKQKNSYGLALLLFLLSMACPQQMMGQAFSGGDGSEASPYLIGKPADMVQLADSMEVRPGFSRDKHFRVTTAELDFSGTEFHGIPGTFRGVFDGQGVVLKNLNMGRVLPGSYSETVSGLFSTVRGRVANVVVDKSCRFGSPSSYKPNTGTIAFDLYGEIENCHNYADCSIWAGIAAYLNPGASIRGCSNHGSGMEAGIADMMSDEKNEGGYATIEDCSNSGSVKCGIVYIGQSHGASHVRVTNCTNSGNVSEAGIGSYIIADRCTNSGEVVGQSVSGIGTGEITNCVNTGNVTGTFSAGGISYRNYSTLRGNIVYGCTIQATGSGKAGAIVPELHSWDSNNYNNFSNNYYINCVCRGGTNDGDVTDGFRAVSASPIKTGDHVTLTGLAQEGDGIVTYEGATYYANGLVQTVALGYTGNVGEGYHPEYVTNSGSLSPNDDGTWQLTMGNYEMTVAAQLAPNPYTLHYIVDEKDWMTFSVNYGDSIKQPGYMPTKTGHSFRGWQGMPADSLMPAHDLNLEALFGRNVYRLTYMDADSVLYTDSIAYGDSIAWREAPEREGYTFQEWTWNTVVTMPASDLEVRAYYNINSYVLQFLVDGKPYGRQQQLNYGATIELPYTPYKIGHTFTAWSGLPADLKMPARDVTAEAMFAVNVHRIAWVVDGDTLRSDSLAYGTAIEAVAAPEREGFHFSGWSYTPETMPDQDVTVTGTFQAGRYTITYLVDGEVYWTVTRTFESAVRPLSEPTREGYTFSGWSEIPATMPAENVTVSGSFAINSYTVTFLLDGDTLRTDSLAYGSSIEVPKVDAPEGYHLDWEGLVETVPARDVVVSGRLTANMYQLTYLVDGSSHQTAYIAYRTAITPAREPQREGYTFSGWSEIPDSMPAHDVVVTGTFTVNRHQLTFMLGEQVVLTDSVDYGTHFDYPHIDAPEGYRPHWDQYVYHMPDSSLTITAQLELMEYITKTIGNLHYEARLRDREATVLSYQGKDSRLEIPDSIMAAGMMIPVTRISVGVFSRNATLTKLHLPNTVKSIGEDAFRECRNLVIDHMPDSLQYIGKQAFRDCWQMTDLQLQPTCRRIEDEAFLYCTHLTNVNIQNPYAYIGERAFQNCYNLAFVALPDSIAILREGLFLNCSSLTTVTLPETVKQIGSRAFKGCSKLAAITCYAQQPPTATDATFDEDLSKVELYVPVGCAEQYRSRAPWSLFGTVSELVSSTLAYWVDGQPYTSYEQILVGTPITPEPAPSKENRAFSGWRDLPAVMPGHDVTAWGGFAYEIAYREGDRELARQTWFYADSISIPDRLQRRGHTLTIDALPATMPARDTTVAVVYTVNKYKVEFILADTVYHTALVDYDARIPLPEAPTREGYDFAWTDVPSRMPDSDITILGQYTPQRMATTVIDGIAYNVYLLEGWAEVTTLPEGHYAGTVIVPERIWFAGRSFPIQRIAQEAFRNSQKMTSISLPSTITSIGQQAFRDCWGLTELALPASVETIEQEAFMYCTHLTTATLGEGITVLLDRLFQYCSNLTHLVLPASLQKVGASVLKGCTSLKQVDCKAVVPPTAGATTFEGAPVAHATLLVPNGTAEQYQVATGWSSFGTILTEEMLLSIPALGTEPVRTGNIYDLRGRLIRPDAQSTEGLPAGAYIIDGRKILFK